MAIPAIRFKPFNEETNLAIADFTDIQTNDIFNSPNAALEEVSDALKDLLDKGKSAIDTAQDTVSALEDELTRVTEDIFSTVKDLTDMLPKDIEKAISDLLPDSSLLQNMFKQLSSNCKKGSLGNRANTRPFKGKSSCGKGGGNCDPVKVGGLLDKVTGGALGAIGGAIGGAVDTVNGVVGAVGGAINGITSFISNTANALNGALNSLIGLANLGYEVGLCKVFQSLSGKLDNNILSRGAAVLMGQLSSKGNTSALIDLAGSAAGLSPLLEFPGAIGSAVNSFNTKGLGIRPGAGMAAFADRFTGSMEILQDDWMMSEDGQNPSIANMGDTFNEDWSEALGAKATEEWVDIDNLDAPALDKDEAEDLKEELRAHRAAMKAAYDSNSKMDPQQRAELLKWEADVKEEDERRASWQSYMTGVPNQ